MCSVMSLTKLAEVFVLGHEIRFAIYLHQHADLALQVNVGSNDAFLGRARRFLARAGDSLGPQNRFGLRPNRRRLPPERVCNPSFPRWFSRGVA